jgi:hypothetical protein
VPNRSNVKACVASTGFNVIVSWGECCAGRLFRVEQPHSNMEIQVGTVTSFDGE